MRINVKLTRRRCCFACFRLTWVWVRAQDMAGARARKNCRTEKKHFYEIRFYSYKNIGIKIES